MSDSPYAPPSAEIHDSTPTAPRAVRIAVALLSVAVVAAVGREAFLSGDLIVSLLMLIPLAFLGFVIYKIWAGRNWARILFLAIVLLGSWGSVPRMAHDASVVPLTATTSFLILAAQVVAMLLLFVGRGSAWFRRSQSVARAVV